MRVSLERGKIKKYELIIQKYFLNMGFYSKTSRLLRGEFVIGADGDIHRDVKGYLKTSILSGKFSFLSHLKTSILSGKLAFLGTVWRLKVRKPPRSPGV